MNSVKYQGLDCIEAVSIKKEKCITSFFTKRSSLGSPLLTNTCEMKPIAEIISIEKRKDLQLIADPKLSTGVRSKSTIANNIVLPFTEVDEINSIDSSTGAQKKRLRLFLEDHSNCDFGEIKNRNCSTIGLIANDSTTETNSVHARTKPDDGGHYFDALDSVFFCPICKEDISNYDSTARNIHMTRCIDRS